MKMCILCGGVGHDQHECPWGVAARTQSVRPLFITSVIVNMLLIGLNILLFMWSSGVQMSVCEYIVLVISIFMTLSGGSWITTELYKAKFWRRWYARWKYRHMEDDLCCCGCEMGTGGGICYHGGCKSAKQHAIDSELK